MDKKIMDSLFLCECCGIFTNTTDDCHKSPDYEIPILADLINQRERETTLLNQPEPKNEIIIYEDDEKLIEEVEPKLDSQPPLEEIKIPAEENDSKESVKNLPVLNEKQEMKTPIILGQTLVVNIGEAVIEVHRGKVTIKSGKENDISQSLNFNPSPSISSYYIDDVVAVNNPPLISCDFIDKVAVVNKFVDLGMQDPSKDITNPQDPNILVEDSKIKIASFHEYPPPPKRKRSNNLNRMVKKWQRGDTLNAKFTLGEPVG